MRTIAIINQKGGCGKTTVSINLAAVLAQRGERTLLVDMDPQSHCALGLAVPEAQITKSTAELMQAGLDGSISVDEVVWQVSRNFDLAPSSMGLAAIEVMLANASDRDRRLVQILSTVQDRYDFCVIDCPPSIGLLTFNALRAADEVVIPVETGYFAMQGSLRQQRTIEMLAQRAGHHVRMSILATMYDVRTKLAREILSEIKRHFEDHMLPVVINFNSKLKEAASFGQPITEYDAASRGMQDFEKLAQWLMDNPPQPVAPTADVQQVAAGSATVATATRANPALSRAAELVERARALAARTAALSEKLARDDDLQAEGVATPRPPQRQQPEQQTPNAPAAQEQADPGVLVASEQTRKLAQINQLYGVRKTSQGLLFVQPLNGARQLAIAGDFNDWQPELTPMNRDDGLGVWQAAVDVPPGRYRYRLVVDGQWIRDPYNQYVETNPFGELNNVVEIG